MAVSTGYSLFRQTEYTIRVRDSNGKLELALTKRETGETWEGSFDEEFVENLTKKTGNLKSFKVFVKMLHSACEQSSESVMVDVLTARDLELLRERKKREAGGPGPGTSPGAQRIEDSKMFVILTYMVEFDKVHYPLSLLKSSPGNEKTHLIGVIESLRKELTFYKSGPAPSRQPQTPADTSLRRSSPSLSHQSQTRGPGDSMLQFGVPAGPVPGLGAAGKIRQIDSKYNFDNMDGGRNGGDSRYIDMLKEENEILKEKVSRLEEKVRYISEKRSEEKEKFEERLGEMLEEAEALRKEMEEREECWRREKSGGKGAEKEIEEMRRKLNEAKFGERKAKEEAKRAKEELEVERKKNSGRGRIGTPVKRGASRSSRVE